MLAETLLAKRVLEYAVGKNHEPGAQAADDQGRRRRGPVLRAKGMSDYEADEIDVVVSRRRMQRRPVADGQAATRAIGPAFALGLPPDHGAPAAGRLGGGQAPGAATPTVGGPAGAAYETPGGPSGPLDGSANESDASRTWVNLGLHCGRHDAWRSPADADGVGRTQAGMPRVEGGPCAQVRRRDLLVKSAIAQHGAPEFIRSDNGSEFIAKELQTWLANEKIKTISIEPAVQPPTNNRDGEFVTRTRHRASDAQNRSDWRFRDYASPE
jgi:hypothetical protein